MDTIELNKEQIRAVEDKLEAFDNAHIGFSAEGEVNIGVLVGGELVGGAIGRMTAYRIFYLSTLFVEERYRKRGVGRRLVAETERRARALGANIIRVDTFDWQGAEFYEKIGYKKVGGYEGKTDKFAEYFFVKEL